MSWAEMGWPEASVFALGGLLILGGCIAFIGGMLKEEKARRRVIKNHDLTAHRRTVMLPSSWMKDFARRDDHE